MPSNHLILCHPLFLLPSIFPRIRVFSCFYCKKKKSKWNVFYFFLKQKSKITYTGALMCMNLLIFMFPWCIKIKGGRQHFRHQNEVWQHPLVPSWPWVPSPHQERAQAGGHSQAHYSRTQVRLTLQLFTCGICQSSLETRGQVFKSQDNDILIKLKKKKKADFTLQDKQLIKQDLSW